MNIILDNFILQTLSMMQNLSFSPLVLIGLMITSLSLLLNLKESNIYLSKFKKHKNSKIFVKKIYLTIIFLIILFLMSLFSNYIPNLRIEEISQITCYGLLIFSLSFLLMLFLIVKNIISISFIIKEIVLSSLND
jgi:hypothetical protein